MVIDRIFLMYTSFSYLEFNSRRKIFLIEVVDVVLEVLSVQAVVIREGFGHFPTHLTAA